MPNMTETPHQTKSSEPTPEQLMQLLDLQITSQRSKRKGGTKRRGLLLVSGLILILGLMFGALFVLQQMVGDLRQSGEVSTQETTMADSQ
jgi:hypothetical protein